MKPWLTYTEAALVAGRSKRTIRLWASNGEIRSRREDDGTIRVYGADVLTVEARKTEYRSHPIIPTRRTG